MSPRPQDDMVPLLAGDTSSLYEEEMSSFLEDDMVMVAVEYTFINDSFNSDSFMSEDTHLPNSTASEGGDESFDFDCNSDGSDAPYRHCDSFDPDPEIINEEIVQAMARQVEQAAREAGIRSEIPCQHHAQTGGAANDWHTPVKKAGPSKHSAMHDVTTSPDALDRMYAAHPETKDYGIVPKAETWSPLRPFNGKPWSPLRPDTIRKRGLWEQEMSAHSTTTVSPMPTVDPPLDKQMPLFEPCSSTEWLNGWGPRVSVRPLHQVDGAMAIPPTPTSPTLKAKPSRDDINTTVINKYHNIISFTNDLGNFIMVNRLRFWKCTTCRTSTLKFIYEMEDTLRSARVNLMRFMFRLELPIPINFGTVLASRRLSVKEILSFDTEHAIANLRARDKHMHWSTKKIHADICELLGGESPTA
ncbi:hypothetical protein Q8F55_001681 [Vanrija albida]|uniref:Uncharacterized protein n=1 Tax=Vanrija albida TaxID=181172 RepID=A0ABR3Q7L8_9TREE